jgi:D-alanyl-D-alanine carboxypeptidase
MFAPVLVPVAPATADCGMRPFLLLAALGASVLACAGRAGTTISPAAAAADPRLDSTRAEAQRLLDSLRVAIGAPGITLGIALPDGRTLALVTGMSDTVARRPMSPDDRLLQGSVGKTYVAAVAMQLVGEGTLDLDAKVSRYLGDLPWWSRVPNAADVTVRQLLTHTSGIVRYEFDPVVADRLKREPMRVWTPAERLVVLLDRPAPFAAGQGWEYSDTNFILVGMIIERLTGLDYYEALRRRILGPLALRNTIPSDRPELPGVANGYAGNKNDLGGYDASVVSRAGGNGGVSRLAVNPQFEWTGGGIASTSADLARWGKLLYEGRAIDSALVRRMVAAAVPARLGRDVKYGLGVMVRPTPLGESWGHSGFFPGYATELLYFPATRVAVAVQVNRTDPYPRGLVPFLVRVAGVAGRMP